MLPDEMEWQRLRTYRTLPEAHLALNELMNSGMTAEVRGEQRAPLAGEIPFADARLEIWIVASQHQAAELLLEEIDAAVLGPSRVCPKCNEENPSSFDLCWQCGTGL